MTRAAALETQETASELPAQVRALGDPFSGSIEEWANRIMTESSKAEVRREALRWKMYAIPTLQGVLLAPDAASAIADTWAFCLQMEQYFEKGERAATCLVRRVRLLWMCPGCSR